jgi:hypothetical protein
LRCPHWPPIQWIVEPVQRKALKVLVQGHWSQREIANKAIRCGLVSNIS